MYGGTGFDDSKFYFYPVPAVYKDNITFPEYPKIHYEITSHDISSLTLYVYNIIGEKVCETELDKNIGVYNTPLGGIVSGLPDNGVYVAILKVSGNGIDKKIVKKFVLVK